MKKLTLSVLFTALFVAGTAFAHGSFKGKHSFSKGSAHKTGSNPKLGFHHNPHRPGPASNRHAGTIQSHKKAGNVQN